MKRIVILFFAVFAASSVYCQTLSLLQEADRCFNNGDYACAEGKYNELYKSVTGNDKQIADIKLTKAKNCIKWIKVADQALAQKDYKVAKENYQYVLDSNANDVYAKQQLAACDKTLKIEALTDDQRLKIVNVLFGSSKKNEEAKGFGEKLYNDIQYLTPKIYFNNLASEEKKVTLYIKVFNPDGTLKSGESSPDGFCYSNDINLSGNINSDQSDQLSGWGNAEGTSYSKEGTYGFEIWCAGKIIYTTKFVINKRSVTKATLEVSPLDISFESSGGERRVTIKRSASYYEIIACPDWCSVSKNPDYCIVTCQPNTGYTERSGSIKIRAGGLEKTVSVKQARAIPVDAQKRINSGEGKPVLTTTLSVAIPNAHFNANGGRSIIDVKTNANTYQIVGLPSWCTLPDKNATWFSLGCEANSSSQSRSGWFKVIAGDKEVKITVYQEGVTAKESSVKKCFNCPKAKDTWGLTLGYVQMRFDDNYYWDGIRLGLRVEPLFKYGFGLNTGILLETYSSNILSALKGDDGYDFNLFAVNIPLHFEYRLNFSKWFNIFVYGGAGFNAFTNSSFDDYSLPTTFEYGAGLRISHVQFNAGQSLYLGDFRDMQYFGENIKLYQNAVSISYMF